MKIELKEIPVRDLVKDYLDSEEEGVIGYGGKLNIRPKYQREFVYKDSQRDEVIRTIKKNFPLNVMYWITDKEQYELLDGQQRTISICEYIKGNFSIDFQAFHNLTKDKQEQILNYKIMIYFCEGTESEKLDWFKTINIVGEKLTNQELRNAVYTGEWLTQAKKYFSKTGCPAYLLAKDYMKGSPIRQDYLETALKWISDDNIEKYMSDNQNKPTAIELWNYFNNVINWVKSTFIVYRKKEMKGIEWGFLYNEHKGRFLDPKLLEEEIRSLMLDEDVTNKRGIYRYVLDKEEKYLSIRKFDERIKRLVYEKQGGICPLCEDKEKHYDIKDMQADHVIPWSKGGKTILENCQLLCNSCNRKKSNK